MALSSDCSSSEWCIKEKNEMRKQFFLIIETQATIDGTVADFGAIVCDKQGRIYAECAVLIAGEFLHKSLFYDKKATGFWSLEECDSRQQLYNKMLGVGNRMLGSATGVSRWLTRAYAKYNAELTAFNLSNELGRLKRTGIDVSEFSERFCLQDAAEALFAQSKKYKVFIQSKSLGTPVQEGNLHTMASFVSGKVLPPESNTALEDVKFYALPIFTAIVNRRNWHEKITGHCGS